MGVSANTSNSRELQGNEEGPSRDLQSWTYRKALFGSDDVNNPYRFNRQNNVIDVLYGPTYPVSCQSSRSR